MRATASVAPADCAAAHGSAPGRRSNSPRTTWAELPLRVFSLDVLEWRIAWRVAARSLGDVQRPPDCPPTQLRNTETGPSHWAIARSPAGDTVVAKSGIWNYSAGIQKFAARHHAASTAVACVEGSLESIATSVRSTRGGSQLGAGGTARAYARQRSPPGESNDLSQILLRSAVLLAGSVGESRSAGTSFKAGAISESA